MNYLLRTSLFWALIVALVPAVQGQYVSQTFKGTRIINGHSIETNAPGVMTFWISHRFGPINDGFKGIFGLDGATIRLGLDYGVTDWLMVGVGRSQLNRTYDGFIKAKLLRQKTGGSPLSISWLSTIAFETIDQPPGRDNLLSSQLFYTHQLLIASKMGNRFSLQLMPSFVHRNLVATQAESNDVIALGVAPRIQLNKNVALIAEYYYSFTELGEGYFNSLSIGVEIDTKGHVFQFSLSNANGMIEKFFIAETLDRWSSNWDDLGVRLGFNITRDFRLRPRK